MSVRQRKLVARLAGLAVPLVAATLLSAESPAHGAPASGRSVSADAGVRQVLTEQQSAWNRGDVDGFLAGYWNSGQTVFAGTQGITRGWQALRERYRRTYPDRRAMGTLAFSDLEVTVLCPDAALALGKWHLDRDSGPLGGVFSLVLRKFPEGWRIIADHTSVVPENQPPRAR